MRLTTSKIIAGALLALLVASCGGGGGDLAQSPLPTLQIAKSHSPASTLVADPASIVTTTTQGAQVLRALGATSDGGYTVAWLSDTSTLYIRHYDSIGEEAGQTLIPAPAGSMAVLQDGSVVVGYGRLVTVQYDEHDYAVPAIYVQRFDAAGAPVSAEIELDRSALPICGWRCIRNVGAVRVQALADGGFVVSWTTSSEDIMSGPTANLSLLRYDMQGQSTGGFGAAGGWLPSFAYGIRPDARGGFTVSVSRENPFTSVRSTSTTHFDAAMHAQSIDVTGLVLALESGYVLFSANADGATRQMLDSSGHPVGEAAAISSVPLEAQELSDGSYVTLWANGTDLVAHRFTPAGATLGEPIPIHSGTTSFLMTSLTDPGFVLAWTGQGANGDTDVYAQRFAETPKGVKKACLDAAKAQKFRGKERKAFMDACAR